MISTKHLPHTVQLNSKYTGESNVRKPGASDRFAESQPLPWKLVTLKVSNLVPCLASR